MDEQAGPGVFFNNNNNSLLSAAAGGPGGAGKGFEAGAADAASAAGGAAGGGGGTAGRAQYSIPGILHFLQHEWARFEVERAQWEVERAELQVTASTGMCHRSLHIDDTLTTPTALVSCLRCVLCISPNCP